VATLISRRGAVETVGENGKDIKYKKIIKINLMEINKNKRNNK